MSSAKWRQFCLSLNVLTHCGLVAAYGRIDLGQHSGAIITWVSSDLSSKVLCVIHLRKAHEHNPNPLQWRHNGCDGVSNHQPHSCLLNRLFGRRLKKTSKLRVTGLCARNSPGTGEFPAQMASNAKIYPFDDVIMHVFRDYTYNISVTGQVIRLKPGQDGHHQAHIFKCIFHYQNSSIEINLIRRD